LSNVIDIDKLVEPIALLYADLDTQLFLNIISRMNIDAEDAGSEAWLRNKINQAPAVSRANGKIINKYNKLIIPEMQKVIKSINTTGKTTESITSILNSFKKYANNMLSFTSSGALESSNSEYLRISNNAFLEASTGLRTFKQSVTRATRELADKGLDVLSYSSGKTINIRSGVAREIRTQTAINARDVQDAYANDFGLTLFEVSSHAGARPGCYPFQGNIYDEGGKSGTVEDIEGRKFKYDSVGRTSIGEPAGLFGINCTHMKYYIEDGLFSKTFDLYTKEGNDIIYEYDQTVRRMENDIQKEKRRNEGFEAINNTEEAKKSSERLKEKRKKLREYKKENLPKMEKIAKESLINIPEPKPKAKPKPKKKVEPKKKRDKRYKTLFKDLNKKDIENIEDAMGEVLKTGLKNEAENMYTYDIFLGKQSFDTVLGEKSQVVFPREYIKHLDDAKKDSKIIIHNHPRSSSFSSADINVLIQKESVKEMLVIAHDETIYRLRKTDKTRRIDITDKYRQYQAQMQIKYQDKFYEKYDKMKDDLRDSMSRDDYLNYVDSKEFNDKVDVLQRVTFKEQSNETVEKLAKYMGLKYERVLKDE